MFQIVYHQAVVKEDIPKLSPDWRQKIKLAIEIDGSQHYTEDGKGYDEMRTKFLISRNIEVIRFSNNSLEKNLGAVLNKIEEKIRKSSRI